MSKKKREPYQPKVPTHIWTLEDGRHLALYTGFDKNGARIYPAPTHTQPMEQIRVEREALQTFIDAMQAHVHREFQKIARAEARWWKSVEEDLGIRRGEAVYFYDGYFEQRPREGDKEKPPTGSAPPPGAQP